MSKIFELPDFQDADTTYLVACGLIRSDDTEVRGGIARLGEKNAVIASVGEGHEQRVVRLLAGGPGEFKDSHFHLDIARPSFFIKAPEDNGTLAEIEEAFKSVLGQKILVTAGITYDFSVESLPAKGIIRSAMISMPAVGGLNVQQVGATLKVMGSPIKEIEWRPGRSIGRVIVSVEVETETIITPDYLGRLQFLVAGASQKVIRAEVGQ